MLTQQKALHIDIPVQMDDVKIVFSVASLSFEGDLPAAIFHMGLIVDDVAGWKANSQVVAVFHTTLDTSPCTMRLTTKIAISPRVIHTGSS